MASNFCTKRSIQNLSLALPVYILFSRQQKAMSSSRKGFSQVLGGATWMALSFSLLDEQENSRRAVFSKSDAENNLSHL